MMTSERPGTEPLTRRQTGQTIAWFRDLNVRGLLNLDPPYQRRSVWNQAFKDFFIDTILHGFPAPPIFLHEEMSTDGVATYNVVDGKQRLQTIFGFVDGLFPVGEKLRYAGLSFSSLPEDVKRRFWTYQFQVEFLPTNDEATLDDIFDRINRNVARLTRQELRHARFSGKFAEAAERMADLLLDELPKGFPRIAEPSRRQMKDVELTAQLLLLVENGPESFSQDDLDEAYAARDEEWERQTTVETHFREVISYLKRLTEIQGSQIASSRLRNQADFYSLFGAVVELAAAHQLPDDDVASALLGEFVAKVDDPDQWGRKEEEYFDAARSASNDLIRRKSRIETIRSVLTARL